MIAGQTEADWKRLAESIHFETKPFIGGKYAPIKSNAVFHTENPATGSLLSEFPDGTEEPINRAVACAREAFRQTWRQMPPDQRKTQLIAFAKEIHNHKTTLALFDCLEMGMPITSALSKVDAAVELLQYYAELPDKTYGEVAPCDAKTTLAMTYREPRGVIGVISPWNSPLLTVILAIAPALAAGNTVVVKPSEQTPSSALKLAEIACNAGLPSGVLNVVPGRGETAGAALATHRDVDMLHFTGSVAVGRQLMVYAGQSNGKPVMLELGGKSPQIVFEDAVDINGLGAALAQSAFINTGQLCVAKTRLIVHENSKDQVLEAIHRETQSVFALGNPLNETTTFGPIASRRQFDRISSYLDLGKQEGAELQTVKIASTLSRSEQTSGYFMQPVIFDNAHNRMRIAQEEIFGPALSVITFKTDEQAVQLANDVNYGLAAAAWTKDLTRARRLARDLDSGFVEIRASAVSAGSDTPLSTEPFANSGYGVVGGIRGLDPYTQFKAVQIVTD